MAAAHRDHNVNLQFEVIDTLDLDKLLALVSELHASLSALSKAMLDVVKNINIVREMLQSFPKRPREAEDT